MVSIAVVFGIFITFFAFVGALRGWAKEVLVVFSMVLAMFLVSIFGQFTPVGKVLEPLAPNMRFLIQASYVIVFAIFGYTGPSLTNVTRGRLARDKLQDVLLGIVFGAINGYLIMSSILYYLDAAGYPYQPMVVPPQDETSLFLIKWMAPNLLKPPMLYFATGLSFLFVIIVFI